MSQCGENRKIISFFWASGVLALALLCSCSHFQSAPTAQKPNPKSTPETEDYLAQVKCPADDTGTTKVLKMNLGKSQQLVACGELTHKLSDTVFVLSGPRIVHINRNTQKVTVLLSLKDNDHREILWDVSDQRALLFEDVPLEKKLPLFSQEIKCKDGACALSDKVCLFRKDAPAFVEPLKTADLDPLLNEPEGQVKILLAALSDFKPAIEVYKNRTPQSVDSKVAESFRLRKNQFMQAQLICN